MGKTRLVALAAFAFAAPAFAQMHPFANVSQVVGADSLRGKEIRLRGQMRVANPNAPGYAGLWLRVDRVGGRMGFFDNMSNRPVRDTSWREFVIEGKIADDAQSILLGALSVDSMTADVDAIEVEVRAPGGAWTPLAIPDAGFEAPSNVRPGWSQFPANIARLTSGAAQGKSFVRMAPWDDPADSYLNAARGVTPTQPFTMTRVAPFILPWRIAFLPDGKMLVTEKIGALWLVSQDGTKTPVANLPRSEYTGRINGTGYFDNNGMLGVYTSPNYATDHQIYLTYSEPGPPYGSSIALARARLSIANDKVSLEDLEVIWRDRGRGEGGQAGGAVTFSPDKQFLFLALGDRNRITPPQDPDQPIGKILRLTLDGKPAPGNPQAGKVGAKTVGIIGWQRDPAEARSAQPTHSYTFPGDNLTPSETWSTGHRNPLGMLFTPDGRLWEIEHGPGGGDELNLIEPGKNYGWPLVSYGRHYNGAVIPFPSSRPDLAKPVIYWSPVIAPGNMVLYNGAMFPQWNGSALIGGLGSRSLLRIIFDGKGHATPAERWFLDKEIRDVAVGPDGAVWLLVNDMDGGLFRLIPK